MSEIGRISGLTELMAKFDQIPDRMQKNILKSAIRAGANTIKDEAKKRIPVDTGNLKKALKVFDSSPRSDKNLVRFNVGFTVGKKARNDGYYAKFVEYGTSKTKAQPFLRPALDASKDKILPDIAAKMESRIEEVLK